MRGERVRKGSKATRVEVSRKSGVKLEKTSLNALPTHVQCRPYTDMYSFNVVTAVMFSGDAYRTPLFSEQVVLDQGTGMIGMATAGMTRKCW